MLGPSCVPKRWASCSRALATRPGTSVKIRSARLLLVRRRRRASTRSSWSEISGRSAIQRLSAERSMDCTATSVTHTAEEVRGPGSKMDSSPNMSDGPRMDSRFSRPSGALRESFTLPEVTMYRLSPCSPSRMITSPLEYSSAVRSARSAEIAAGSTPWKIPARVSTSSADWSVRRSIVTVCDPPFGRGHGCPRHGVRVAKATVAGRSPEMCPTRGRSGTSVVDLLWLVEDRVLEPVHEECETGEEDRDQDDEDSLHAPE